MKDWLRLPALHFLLIGGLLFAADAWWRRASRAGEVQAEVPKTIVISAAEIAQLRRQWYAQSGRLPDPGALRAAIDHAIDEEVLYREALARELDRDDEVVRQRLVSVMGFLSDDEKRDATALYRAALELGLDRNDLVVRRHLVQLMRLLARRPEVPRPVTDAELVALLEREPERWQRPAEVTLTHVFLSASRRGSRVDRDARDLLERLLGEHAGADRASALGDPFPLGTEVRHAAERDLQRIFGAGFAQALAEVKPGQWSGPIRSSYGGHLVWVRERIPPRVPPLEAIRSQLLQQLRDQRGEERARAKLRAWRAGYTIEVADAGQAEARFDPALYPARVDVTLPRPQPFLGD